MSYQCPILPLYYTFMPSMTRLLPSQCCIIEWQWCQQTTLWNLSVWYHKVLLYHSQCPIVLWYDSIISQCPVVNRALLWHHSVLGYFKKYSIMISQCPIVTNSAWLCHRRIWLNHGVICSLLCQHSVLLHHDSTLLWHHWHHWILV